MFRRYIECTNNNPNIPKVVNNNNFSIFEKNRSLGLTSSIMIQRNNEERISRQSRNSRN